MTMPPRPERLRRVTLAGYPQDGDKLVRWFLDGLVVGSMLMQNRTLASARPAMTAQGGLPTFLLEALNGRIAPMAVIPGRLGVPRMQTFAQAWW
jgi:hypothetical protein